MGFYDYYVTDAKGNQVSLKEYENKVVLVVNTATACGFTPQYEELEKLHENYNEQGLEILVTNLVDRHLDLMKKFMSSVLYTSIQDSHICISQMLMVKMNYRYTHS